MSEATILRATLLRGLRNAIATERNGGWYHTGLGDRHQYRLALVRFRALRAKDALGSFWQVKKHIDTPLGTW